MKKRPTELVSAERVRKVIESSIEGVIEWSEKTNNAFYDPEERIDELNELMDIVFELSWRYGAKNVGFKFSQKKKIEDAVPVSDIVDTDYWANRIHILENIQGISIVYINF